jgi:hypothetical protein
MTRQEAYEFLVSYMLAPPTPDPETGLMPCGCGGKAVVSCDDVLGDDWHYAECTECLTKTRCYGTEKEAKGAWNRAMGWQEGGQT